MGDLGTRLTLVEDLEEEEREEEVAPVGDPKKEKEKKEGVALVNHPFLYYLLVASEPSTSYSLPPRAARITRKKPRKNQVITTKKYVDKAPYFSYYSQVHELRLA